MSTATATMRVNIYAEALRPLDDGHPGSRVYLHTKQVKDEQDKDLEFVHRAIRILIGERVIHTNKGKKRPDDDTAAVTFWYSDENQRQMLRNIFEKALAELDKPEAKM